MNRIVHLLRFQTEKAQMVVKNGVDHHHTRLSLSSSWFALAKEVLIPFLHYCRVNGITENNKNCLQWVHRNCNEEYMLFNHITFSYLLAFNLYTKTTPKNHSVGMMVARVQFLPLFYFFKHPKYQKLYLRELLEGPQIPESLKSYVEYHERFSVTIFHNIQGDERYSGRI